MGRGPSKRAITLRVQRLPHATGLPLPSYQTAGAAGLDLLAALDAGKPVTLDPGGRALLPTGLVLELPAGFEAQVRPRSGLAARHGVTVLNSPGTVDSDYRGELSVILVNLGQAPFVIRRGERIAQLIIAPVARARLEVVAAVSETARGSGGFGSTGVGPPKPQHTAHSKKAAQKKKAVPSKNPAGERRARKVAAMRSRSSH